ncbi:MAG TPA: MBL fold metallo-hydrolase [Phycisphaerae bacterium]|nr:MBL fold metallo-hydrolase [Phycisphaerae bacterium]HNU43943.1 MBL fold metallo-hydrolase [Phycisphaerae bacterium]
MLSIPPFELHSIVTGTLRLDGGAMFGVVPKVLWRSKVDVDEDNRILLATRTLLAVNRAARQVIIVETGCGTKWKTEAKERFDVRFDAAAVDRALETHGYRREDVTDVVITHLHFDHNGGLTEWAQQPGGPTRLSFPRARHWVHRGHWEHAGKPTPRDRASFRQEDFGVLADSPLLRLVDGNPPPPALEGVEWWVTQGHTPCQLLPLFGTGPQRLLFVGDTIPTVNHLPVAWVMAYDQLPVTTMSEKQRIYAQCHGSRLLLAFPHDPQYAAVELDPGTAHPIVARSLDM